MASAKPRSFLGRILLRKTVAQVQRETETSELKRSHGAQLHELRLHRRTIPRATGGQLRSQKIVAATTNRSSKLPPSGDGLLSSFAPSVLLELFCRGLTVRDDRQRAVSVDLERGTWIDHDGCDR